MKAKKAKRRLEVSVAPDGNIVETWVDSDGVLVDDNGRRRPTNTTKMFQDAEMLRGFILSKGDIPAQERNGQREIVNSDTIPIQYSGYRGAEDGDEILRKLGFELGEKVPGDPLFRYVTLPAGWKRQRTDHAMWSKIVDENGLERMSIFYKAAFYDRCAHFSLRPRITCTAQYLEPGTGCMDKQIVIVDHATNKLLFASEVLLDKDYVENKQALWNAQDEATKQAKAWMEVYFPDHDNPAAYWGKEGDKIIENNDLKPVGDYND